jgi:predicted ABC-type ATPase
MESGAWAPHWPSQWHPTMMVTRSEVTVVSATRPLSDALKMSPYDASELAAAIRSTLVQQRESFVFETVLSDPVGDKVETLASYAALGYTVVLIFIRIDSPEESIRRVAIRVSQGGHDVPDDKLRTRFERTKANLERAIERLPHVIVYGNDDLAKPFQLVDLYEYGQRK